ncbi:MAG: hypothetical protein NTV25_08430 [Methanothrix sp.]|nr:hypothetical protein [Methanothrix sp.]
MLEGKVWGPLRGVEEFCRGLIVARIGIYQVILPSELEGKLQDLVGKKVTVAKIEGKCYAAERKPPRLRL